jgi:hypothetical protein
MSEFGDSCGSDHSDCNAPVAGNIENAMVGEARPPESLVVRGVEINRAKILEKSHERVLKKQDPNA